MVARVVPTNSAYLGTFIAPPFCVHPVSLTLPINHFVSIHRPADFQYVFVGHSNGTEDIIPSAHTIRAI